MESPTTNTSLSYWKGRVFDAESAYKANPTAEFKNALDYAKYQVARLETRYFSRKSPKQK